jgi:hypothetical protein
MMIVAGALGAALVTLVGCTSGGVPTPGTSSSAPGGASPTPGGTGTIGTAAPPTAEPSGDGVEYQVTYQFAVPNSEVSITNPSTAPNLPRLVAVYAADHPEGNPTYQRISFYFRGAFPSYRFHYVSGIVQDGSGEPVALAGTYFLSVVFDGAQAHDDGAASTVAESPTRPVNLSGLRDYAPAGDFEGQVSYGLGVNGSGGNPAIRSGELKRPDGAGDFFYVVHFDVRTG